MTSELQPISLNTYDCTVWKSACRIIIKLYAAQNEREKMGVYCLSTGNPILDLPKTKMECDIKGSLC